MHRPNFAPPRGEVYADQGTVILQPPSSYRAPYESWPEERGSWAVNDAPIAQAPSSRESPIGMLAMSLLGGLAGLAVLAAVVLAREPVASQPLPALESSPVVAAAAPPPAPVVVAPPLAATPLPAPAPQPVVVTAPAISPAPAPAPAQPALAPAKEKAKAPPPVDPSQEMKLLDDLLEQQLDHS